MSPETTHKLMGFYMEVLILGVIQAVSYSVYRVKPCALIINTVINANEKSSLDEFRRWVEVSTFWPRPHVSLQVEIVPASDTVVLPATCEDCRKKWGASKLEEVMGVINWRNVVSLDLSVVVSQYTFIVEIYGAIFP